MSSVRTAVAVRFGPRLIMAIAIVVALMLLASACGSSGGGNTNTNALSAITSLDSSGMHEIDDAIQGGTIPPNAQSVASHMQTALLATEWPASLKAPATKLAGLFGALATTLNTDKPDIAKAKAASADAHAAWHQFSGLVWTYLGGKAGVKVADAPDN